MGSQNTKSGDIFYAFVVSLHNDDPWMLYHDLQIHRQELDSDQLKALKDKYFSLSFLISHPNSYGILAVVERGEGGVSVSTTKRKRGGQPEEASTSKRQARR